MLIVATNNGLRDVTLTFLREHGVRLHASDDYRAIARIEHDEIIGVVAYNGFCGRVCSMHVAGVGNWVTRSLVRFAFGYPFVQLKLAAIVSPVAADNVRALRFDKHLGFREAYRVRDGWADGVDLVLLEMKREDCKFIGVEDDNARLVA